MEPHLKPFVKKNEAVADARSNPEVTLPGPIAYLLSGSGAWRDTRDSPHSTKPEFARHGGLELYLTEDLLSDVGEHSD